MSIPIRTDRNLTVIRSGLPADAIVRLILWNKTEIGDMAQGSVAWLCRWFNNQRVHGGLDSDWTATFEEMPMDTETVLDMLGE